MASEFQQELRTPLTAIDDMVEPALEGFERAAHPSAALPL